MGVESPVAPETAIETARFYELLLQEALVTIEHEFQEQGGSAWMISGPIGLGDTVQANMAGLQNAMAELRKERVPVVDQTRWHNSKYEHVNVEHSHPLKLEKFYKPLIGSGKIKGLYMMPDWESSTGAQIEHEEAQRLGLPIRYL